MFNFPKKTTALREQLKNHRGELTAALEGLRSNIANLEAERAALRASPISRDEYAAAVLANIDRRADEQLKLMAGHFRACAEGITHSGRSAATVAKALASAGPLPTPREFLYGMPLNNQGGTADALQVPMAYALFRDEIKRTAREAIDLIQPWPFRETVSLESAQVRLREIDAALTELRAEEAALTAEAAEFGASA